MIVRADGNRQLLITQPDHAALAARLMREWRADGLPDSPRRDVILLAIERHDHGWLEVDSAPMVDDESGEILDFIGTPDDIKRGVWPNVVAQLEADPYAAALVAQHAVHIYRRYRGNPDWMPFFYTMETARDRQLLRSTPLVFEDLERDYVFLRVGDLLSLTFCNGWTDVQQDDLGLNYSFHLEGNRVTVTPDPFQGREIPFEVSARALPLSGFRSPSEAQAAFAAAPIVVLSRRSRGRLDFRGNEPRQRRYLHSALAGPHPRSLSLAHSRSLGPQAPHENVSSKAYRCSGCCPTPASARSSWSSAASAL